MKKLNKTDIIISEKDILKNPIYFKDFKYRSYFNFLCKLKPDVEKERIIITENSNEELINRHGLLYAFVLNDILIKIGSSTVSFKDRVSSYNCGRRAFRKNGTCSTTNYLVLQSFLNIDKKIDVYYYFPEKINFTIWGEIEEISLPAKRFEKKILTELKKNNQFPILCTQQ